MPATIQLRQQGLEASIENAMKKAGKNLRLNLGNTRNIDTLVQPLGRLTGKADEFTKSMEAANARVLAFGASVSVIAGVSKAFEELVKTTINVQKSLANINSILNQTQSQLNSFKNNLFEVAKNTEQTFDTVATAALELSRQGLKGEEVTKRLNDSLILARLSGLDAADAVSGLTAAINTFSSAGITSEQVLNKISAAAASAAVSDRDLIEGLKRSGSVANSTGVQFDELVGIISALQERTARGGAVIGNSLKTIFTRIQDIERLKSLQALGVQVTDLQGEVLAANKIIENLAPTFAKLDQSTKVNLADNLVGKFQIAPFLALLEDYNSEIIRSNEVAQNSFNATREAYERNAALNETLSAAINRTVVNLEKLGTVLGEIGVTDNFQKLIGFFDTIVTSITEVFEGEGIGSDFAKSFVKGISSVLSGPGLALALAIVGKLLIDFAKFSTKSLTTFFNLNKASKEQAIIQGQITSTLLNDSNIRKQILNIEKQSITEEEKRRKQTEAITLAMNAQLNLMKQLQGISFSIADEVLLGTALARTSAGGFLPIGAEKADISKGVGGAPSSAKPVVIPNFAFGGGKRGTMVANDSEYIVPNYANGGDAIFNQNMVSSMGLPANAKKIRAAGGYIPNFAEFDEDLVSVELEILRGKKSSRKNLNSIIQDKRGNKTPEQKEAAKRKLSELDQKSGKPFVVNADRYGIASLFQKKLSENSETGKTLDNDLAKQIMAGGATSIKFKNPQIKSLNDLNSNLREKENEFRNTITELFIGPLAALSSNIIGSTFSGNDGQDFQKEIKKVRLEGGGVDLFNSSVQGGIFEAAVKIATKKSGAIQAFKDIADEQKPFDFEEEGPAKEALIKAFGFNSRLVKADAKRTASAKEVRSIIKKAFNDPQEQEFLKSEAKRQGFITAAGGYIPNYVMSPLEDAIVRERAAGVPINQIRINQDGGLRNSQNPQGLAVTNTRDEPTGAIPNFVQQGVYVAASNAQSGYAEFDRATIDAQKTEAEAREKSAKAQVEAQEKSVKSQNDVVRANRDYLGTIFAVQAGLTALNGATQGVNDDFAKLINTFSGITSSIASFGFAAQAASSFGKNLQTSKNDLTKSFGKIIGKAGLVGAAIGTGFEVFNLGKEIYREFTGANERAALALAKLEDSSDSLSFAFENINKEQQIEIQRQAGFTVRERKFNAERDRSGRKRSFDRSFETEDIENAFVDVAARFIALGETEDQVNKRLQEFGKDLSSDELKSFLGEYEIFSKTIRNSEKQFRKSLLEFFKTFDRSILDATSISDLSKLADVRKLAGNLPFEIIQKVLNEEKQNLLKKDDEDIATVDRINNEAAKARLKTAIEIKKIQIQTIDSLDKEILKAEKLGGIDIIRLNNLKKQQQLRDFDRKFQTENLDFINEQVGQIKKLSVSEEKVQQFNERISSLKNEQLKDGEEIKKLAEEILGIDTKDDIVLNSKINAIASSLSGRVKEFEAARKSKEETLKENEALNNRSEILKRLNIEREILSKRDQFDSVFSSNQRIGQLQSGISSREQQINSGRLNPVQQEQLRRQNVSSQQQIERERIVQERANLLQNAKNVSNIPDEIFDETVKRLNNTNNVNDIVSFLEGQLSFLKDPAEKKNLQLQIDNLKREKQNLDLQESNLKTEQSIQSREESGFNKTLNTLRTSIESSEKFGSSASSIERQRQRIAALQAPGAEIISQAEAEEKFNLRRSIGQRIAADDRFDPTVTSSKLKDDLIEGSYQFLLNMDKAFQNALSQTDSLGDALLEIGREFLGSITSAFANKFISDAFGSAFGRTTSISSIQQRASGGYISGGSGVKDDVPAMLMSGEYVMNKRAVMKYGTGFMNALNRGSIQGFSSGGYVDQKKDREGMFTTPGMNGAGSITGGSNLLSFATQTPAAMGRDSFLLNSGATAAFLSPESARLTTFGRRNNNQFERVQKAKRAAFDLYISEKRAEEEARKIARDSKNQFGKDLLAAGVSSLVGSGLSALGTKVSSINGFKKLGKGIGLGSGFGGNIAGALVSGGSSYSIFGGFGAGAERYGREILNGLFTEKVDLSNLKVSSLKGPFKSASSRFSGGVISRGAANSGTFNKSKLPTTSSRGGLANIKDLSPRDVEDIFFGGRGMLPKLATGGMVPRTAGVDTVPTMLSGGEFVMNSAATKKIGAGKLQALNSGVSGESGFDLSSKIDELIIATENIRGGEINITINGERSESVSSQGSNSEQERKLAEKIKVAVKQVIKDEKRLSGLLNK